MLCMTTLIPSRRRLSCHRRRPSLFMLINQLNQTKRQLLRTCCLLLFEIFPWQDRITYFWQQCIHARVETCNSPSINNKASIILSKELRVNYNNNSNDDGNDDIINKKKDVDAQCWSEFETSYRFVMTPRVSALLLLTYRLCSGDNRQNRLLPAVSIWRLGFMPLCL